MVGVSSVTLSSFAFNGASVKFFDVQTSFVLICRHSVHRIMIIFTECTIIYEAQNFTPTHIQVELLLDCCYSVTCVHSVRTTTYCEFVGYVCDRYMHKLYPYFWVILWIFVAKTRQHKSVIFYHLHIGSAHGKIPILIERREGAMRRKRLI